MSMSQLNVFIREFNEAFVTGNTDFILANVTEDVKWTMIGDNTINGKDDVRKELEMMDGGKSSELTITTIITHGRTASVEGTMKLVDQSGEYKTYAFCDTYVLNKFKNGKIKELNSYVIEVKEQ